jgi:hypothetical protein
MPATKPKTNKAKILINRNFLTFQEIIRNQIFTDDCNEVYKNLELDKVRKKIEESPDLHWYENHPEIKQIVIDGNYKNESDIIIEEAVDLLIKKYKLEQLNCKENLIILFKNKLNYETDFNSIDDIILQGGHKEHYDYIEEIEDSELERAYPIVIRFGAGTTTGALKKFIDDNAIKIRSVQSEFKYTKEKFRNSKKYTIQMRDFIWKNFHLKNLELMEIFNLKFSREIGDSVSYSDIGKLKSEEKERRNLSI